MKRKIVKQGAATLMVSLPSKWARQYDVKKGDSLDIEEKQNTLIVSVEATKHKNHIEINVSSLTESSIRTILANVYRLGYDTVKVNYKDSKAFEIIQEVVHNNLLGFEIIRKKDNSCDIENITEPSQEQFDNIFNKIMLNIEELFNLVKLEFNGEKSNYYDVEQKIQQFDNFCKRVITKYSLFDNYQLRWSFHVELIHAQRELYHMLKYLDKNKVKIDPSILNLLEECRKLFEDLRKAYSEKNIVLLEKIHEAEKKLVYKEGYVLLNKTKNPVVAHHILSAIRNFYLASSPLIGLFLEVSKTKEK